MNLETLRIILTLKPIIMNYKGIIRSLSLACVTLLVPSLLCAQVEDVDDIRFGLKFSPNLSWINPDMQGVDQNGSQFGFTFGLITELPVGSGNYAFGTGINLVNIGGSIQYPAEYSYADPNDTTNQLTASVNLNNKYALQYISLPLTMKLKTNEIGYITYFGQVGFDLGFNIRAKADVDEFELDGENVARVSTEVDRDVLDEIKFFRTALVVGAGIEYNFSGPTSLLVGVQYNSGFSNIADRVDLLPEKKTKLLANHLELTLGIYF